MTEPRLKSGGVDSRFLREHSPPPGFGEFIKKACELQALEELEHGKKTRNEICFKDLLAVVCFHSSWSAVFLWCLLDIQRTQLCILQANSQGGVSLQASPTARCARHCVLIFLLVDDVDAHDDQKACLVMYVLR